MVRDGDTISPDVPNRTLTLEIPDDELERRLKIWIRPDPEYTRGYYRLYIDTVLQADQGCDFDFLVGKSTRPVTRDSH